LVYAQITKDAKLLTVIFALMTGFFELLTAVLKFFNQLFIH